MGAWGAKTGKWGKNCKITQRNTVKKNILL